MPAAIMISAMQTNPAKQLIALALRAGLSQAELSKLARFRTPSGIQRYFKPEHFEDGQYFGTEVVARLCSALVGRGKPAITPLEVLQLAGIPEILNSVGYRAVPIAEEQAASPILSEEMFVASIKSAFAGYEKMGIDPPAADLADQALRLYVAKWNAEQAKQKTHGKPN